MSRARMNIMIIGDGKVGKTSILKMYDKKKFQGDHIRTIGIDYIKQNIERDGHKLEVKLWDTAGQERFKTMTYQFYRQADGIIIAFDLTNKQSFQNVQVWI